VASTTIQCPPGDAGSACVLPANTCCRTKGADAGSVYDCESVSKCNTAGGSQVDCFGTSDCASGSICCLAAVSASVANLTCQAGTTCPTGDGGSALAEGQICSGNSDCANSTCLHYICAGSALEACMGSITGIIASACSVVDAGGS
jgi:hypothetical protein